MAYKKCTRCNLNYIKDAETYCKVCLEDLGKSQKSDIDDEEYDICPECGENVIRLGEDMCSVCVSEKSKEVASSPNKKSTNWDKIRTNVEEVDVFHNHVDEDNLIEIEKDEIDETHVETLHDIPEDDHEEGPSDFDTK